MADETEVYTVRKCINQLYRPKMEVPKEIRPKGCGNCFRCRTHKDNLDCSCYWPVGLMKFKRKK